MKNDSKILLEVLTWSFPQAKRKNSPRCSDGAHTSFSNVLTWPPTSLFIVALTTKRITFYFGDYSQRWMFGYINHTSLT